MAAKGEHYDAWERETSVDMRCRETTMAGKVILAIPLCISAGGNYPPGSTTTSTYICVIRITVNGG